MGWIQICVCMYVVRDSTGLGVWAGFSWTGPVWTGVVLAVYDQPGNWCLCSEAVCLCSACLSSQCVLNMQEVVCVNVRVRLSSQQ